MNPEMKSGNPDQFAGFYSGILQIDYKLTEYCYVEARNWFVGKTCLELGPSTGYMTRYLVNDFESLTAVEGAAELLEKIPDHPALTKVHSLFQNFCPTEKFDTIVLNHVLEHIAEPVELLIKIKSWLAPGGRFIVGVPNARSFHRMAAVKMGMLDSIYSLNERDHALGHERVYDMDTLRAHLQKAGFLPLAEKGIFMKFLSNGQIENWFNPQMIEAFYELGKEFPDNCAEIMIIAE